MKTASSNSEFFSGVAAVPANGASGAGNKRRRAKRSLVSDAARRQTWMIAAATWRHDGCREIDQRARNGEKLSLLFREFARRPGKFRLSPKSWERVFRNWRRGGGVPSAVAFRYSGATSSKLTQPTQLRFIKIVFRPETRSLAHAYELFARKRGSRRNGHRVTASPVSRCTLIRALPPKVFRRIRAERASIARSALVIARLKLEAEALALKLPFRIKRVRRNLSDHYQI